MCRFALCCVILLTTHKVSAQVKPVHFEHISNLQAKEKRLVMVIVEADWCKYCHALKQHIIRDKEISATLSKSFYVAFLNGEEKRDIVFAGRKFKAQPNGIHQLADQLGTIEGKVTYPSLCFLNDKNEIIYQYSGYLKPASFLRLLTVLSKK
ncbi:MAG TPA: thioredoxin family protein [Sphingobacteriaceae bacterium]